MGGQVSVESESQVPLFGSHRHIALVYDRPDDQAAATGAFFKEGLRRGHFCLYAHEPDTEASVVRALIAAGVDIPAATSEGRLTLADTRTAFLAGDSFDPDAMLGTLQATVDKATDMGLEGLFVAGEMSWALGPHPGAEQLMEYEALCNQFFTTNPAVSLCQYNRHRFGDRAIVQVLLTHPWVLIGGRLCRNYHHVPPGELLASAGELPLDVDQLLSDLLVRDAAERMAAATTNTIEGGFAADLTVADARRMVTIYGELEEFRLEVLARAERRAWFLGAGLERSRHDPELSQLKGDLVGIRERLRFWQDRVLQMVQLDHDSARRLVRFNGRSVRLSRRESQLIEALIVENGRPLSVRELLNRAWGGSRLSEAQLRTYIARLRKKLALLEVPAALVNQSGVGYTLQFDSAPDGDATEALAFVEIGPGATETDASESP